MNTDDALLARAVESVWGLVSAALVVAFTVDEGGLLDRAVAARSREGASAEAFVELLQRLEPIDPFSPRRARACDAALVSAADFGGSQRYGQSLYARHLWDHGYGAPVFVYLRHDGAIVAGIALLREFEAPPFEVGTLQLLRRLVPLLEQSLRLREGKRMVHPLPATLTVRERQVAGMVVGGCTNADIAKALTMSPATVKAHLTKVYAKAGVRTRTQLAVALGGTDVQSAS